MLPLKDAKNVLFQTTELHSTPFHSAPLKSSLQNRFSTTMARQPTHIAEERTHIQIEREGRRERGRKGGTKKGGAGVMGARMRAYLEKSSVQHKT